LIIAYAECAAKHSATVKAWPKSSNLSDPTVYDQLPTLVNLAERRLARELKIQGTVTVLASTFVQGEPRIAKPDRWRETVSMRVGTGASNDTLSEIYPRAYEYIRMFWPDQTNEGVPRFYADYDFDNWIVAPTPDDAYPYEVLCYELPPLLDETTQTNWYTEKAPDALLYASLLEATPFLKDDARIKTWEGFLNRAISVLNGEDIRMISDRSIVRRED
jgi:hypothetical protein